MTIEEFRRLHNFSITEQGLIDNKPIITNLEIIRFELMKKLDDIVTFAKELYGTKGRFIVHCIAYGSHSDKSQHYLGRAVDGHFVGLSLSQTACLMFKAGFKGIGLYYEWANPGIHADIREQSHVSTWLGYYLKDHNGDFIIGDDGKRIQRYEYDYGKFMDQLLARAA